MEGSEYTSRKDSVGGRLEEEQETEVKEEKIRGMKVGSALKVSS